MSNEMTIKKTTLWQAIAGILFLLLLASIFTGGFGLGEKDNGNGVIPAQPKEPTAPQRTDLSNWDLSDEPVLGDLNAPVTIIEFSDFECPFCERAVNGGLKQVITEYIDTGKAKLIFRNFPLSFHQYAQVAAEASECANDQGKFWELHDMMFNNQANLNKENIIKWAGEVGINTAKLQTCLSSGKFTQEVKDDFTQGQQAGVSGTPSFFINGQLIVGAQPFEAFEQLIEAELK